MVLECGLGGIKMKCAICKNELKEGEENKLILMEINLSSDYPYQDYTNAYLEGAICIDCYLNPRNYGLFDDRDLTEESKQFLKTQEFENLLVLHELQLERW